jgi:tagatose-1,6-bisphosphate aldolase
MQKTIGKFRGLQQCASSRGTFTCLALDHRQNLRRSLNPDDPNSIPNSALTDFKLEVCAALAKHATAILLDPEYSAAQAIANGSVPGDVGLVVAVESTGYTGSPTARQSQILPGWNVEKAKRMGASAIKLLVYYHPESPTAADIESFVRQIAEDCKKHDLALMLEPLSYSMNENKTLTSVEKRYIVVETAKRLTPLGVDLLKAEFPMNRSETDQNRWREACEELSSVSQVPWIILSAAVDYEVYVNQVAVACKAGASGVAVGRAVWKEAVELKKKERDIFLSTIAVERLAKLKSLCYALGKPFIEYFQAQTLPDWYKNY